MEKALAFQSNVAVNVVTEVSQLPDEFLNPSHERQIVIGFDCEGVDLAREGRLCIMQALYFQYGIKLNNVVDTQIAYSLIEEQEGRKWTPDDYISFVGLLADPRYCGISYVEKEEVRNLLRQDQEFWAHRPLTEMMKKAAADDVRFLLHIYNRMMEKLDEHSLWQLFVRGALYCRCFCVNDNGFGDWPPLPTMPESLKSDRTVEEEILSVMHVPKGKMGHVIGKKGAFILLVKQCCKAEIFMGGAKGPPDKIFIIGTAKEVHKAEAILRGKML